MPALLRPAFYSGVALCLLCISHAASGKDNPPPAEVRITSYNVENYLVMPRRVGGKLLPNVGKPESERAAVTRMIGTVQPDVLGLEEIGESTQLDDLQRRLKNAGMDYPYREYLQGNDTSRHIALLSRYRILESHSRGDLPLWVNGVTLHSPRGMIDVTIEPVPGYRLRILLVHLKAKLEVAEYDEASLRLAESKEVRRTVRNILSSDPDTRLVLMGDFNDTKNERSIWQISGKPDWPDSLHAVPLADDRGEFWTEYWSAADVYSRIDYILVAKKLEGDVDPSQSGIARPSFWNEASDHCPVTLSLKLPQATLP
jgi:endonuclease/exonuclease/phosphatase family metal-dependent hydrolase